MAKLSRRNLLARTGMGAVAAGALTAAPIVGGLRPRHAATRTAGARNLPAPSTIPSVAYIRDAKKGEVVLMYGTREVVRTDPALVAYLGRCCEGSAT